LSLNFNHEHNFVPLVNILGYFISNIIAVKKKVLMKWWKLWHPI